MKKVKLLSTMALAAVLSAGSVLPVFAYTANGAWSSEQHTTFGIQEGAETDFANQASFEVPLYVTMAAISDRDTLATPDGYDVKNSATKAGSFIAVQSLDVEMYQDATWSIVNDKADVGTDDKKMTFTMGTQKLVAQTSGTTVSYGVTGQNKDQTFAVGTFAKAGSTLKELDAQEYLSSGTSNPGTGIKLSGDIYATTRAKNTTTAQFRVIYHMVPTDGAGNVKTAATYVGDNKKDAGYK